MFYLSMIFLCLFGISVEGIAFQSIEDCEKYCNAVNEACEQTETAHSIKWFCMSGIVKKGTAYSARIIKRCVRDDACACNPCLNGGTCNRQCQSPGFICTCAAGYSGPDCATPPVNPCRPNPCQNGGTCVSASSDFTCRCPSGYTGELCQNEIPPE